MELKEKKCVPCEGGVPKLNNEEISGLMKQIHKDWYLIGADKIQREFFFVNFKQTIDFVNKVAEIAESEGHHPVMHVYYGKLMVELWTHAIEGLSENDFILASKIDAC
jgi:4a-hydroxytetrahydrobiopterin dehydratase